MAARTALVAALVLASQAATGAAEPEDPPLPPPVNSICPVLGDRCPDHLPVVVVTITDAQGRPRQVAVAVCSPRCAALVRADPQRYGAAALGDRKAK